MREALHLIVVCFVVALLIQSEGLPSLVGKTGVFASIIGIFGLYLEFERKSVDAARARSQVASLLTQALEVIRDPAEQAKIIHAAKDSRKSAIRRSMRRTRK
jgi:hypothetical protein